MMLLKIPSHFALLVTVIAIVATDADGSHITLHSNNSYTLTEFTLAAKCEYKVRFDPVLSRNLTYLIQFHTPRSNVSLLLQDQLATYRDIGTDLGVVLSPSDSKDLYISNNHNSSVIARANAKKLAQSVPLPGGCNEEFNLPRDPRIIGDLTEYTYRLTFQYSSVADWDTCDKKELWDRLEYRVFIQYNGMQTDSDAILYTSMSELLDTDNIPKRSFSHIVLGTRSSIGQPRFDITRFRSGDLTFIITVTDKVTGGIGAYVPTIVQSPGQKPAWYWYPLTALLALLSLPILYFSHSWFSFAQFYAGSVAVAVVSIMSLGALHVTPVGLAFGSLAFALFGGCLWLLVWKFVGKPTLSITLISMVGGYLFTSICFFSPLVSIQVFRDYSWEVWMIIAIVILAALAASLISTKKLHILSSVFISSYIIIMAVSLYCESIFHLIVVERFRRAVVSDYSKALFATDFQAKDGGLLALWVFLLITGAVVQFYRTRNDPDVPTAPDRWCSGPRTTNQRINDEHSEGRERLLNKGQQTENLSQHIPHYGAVDS